MTPGSGPGRPSTPTGTPLEPGVRIEEIALNDVFLWSVLGLAVLNVVLLLWVAFRRSDKSGGNIAQQGQLVLLAAVQASTERLDRLERELRREISESSRGGRQELTQNPAVFQRSLVQQGAEATRTQNTQIEANWPHSWSRCW